MLDVLSEEVSHLIRSLGSMLGLRHYPFREGRLIRQR